MLGEEHRAGGEGLSEHLDEQVELPQVLSTVGHEGPHQLIVTLLLVGRWLLIHQRETTDVLLILVEHIHQHLHADKQVRQVRQVRYKGENEHNIEA